MTIIINGDDIESQVCPKCDSENIWKDGKRITGRGLVQRYLCGYCGYRFSGSLIFSGDHGIFSERQVCVIACGAKNLIVAKEEKWATGEISETKSLITQFIIYLIGRGNKESTIE